MSVPGKGGSRSGEASVEGFAPKALRTAPLSDDIERQVERVQLARRLAQSSHCVREDREFARLMSLLESRIAHYIRTYRLTDMHEDAYQACAIAVLRALDTYDPRQARFTTHATWQLRGELQSLRHRVRLDQRRSARSAGITTVQLEALSDESSLPYEIMDREALARTEAGASDAMALQMMDALLDAVGSPAHERVIMYEHVLGVEHQRDGRAAQYSAEQRRQITRRTWRNCAKVVGG